LRFYSTTHSKSIFAGLGSTQDGIGVYFYQEINREYIKTARAKGLSEIQILFKHLLPNAMLPILTGVVVIIPTLFMGSLIMESFFGIPGLGSYTIDAISLKTLEWLKAMVFLGSFMYIVGLILTEYHIEYLNPRVEWG